VLIRRAPAACALAVNLSLTFVTGAEAQSYICDRLKGWNGAAGDDCLAGRCWQRAADGTVWARDELMGSEYRVTIPA